MPTHDGDGHSRESALRAGDGVRRRSVVVALRVTALVSAVVVMVSLVAWAFVHNEAERRESTLRQFDARTTTGGSFVQAYVTEVLSRESRLATLTSRGTVSPESFDQVVRYAGFRSGALLDSTGHVLAASPYDPKQLGKRIADTYPHIRRALGGRLAVSGVVPSLVEGIPVVSFAVPFLTPQGWRVFSASYAVQDTPLYSFLNNATALSTYEAYVVDESGAVVSVGGDATLVGRLLSDRDPEVARALAATSSGTGFIGSGPDERYFTSVQISNAPWRLIFVAPTDVLYEQTASSMWRAQWTALAGFALVCLVAIVLFERNLAQRTRWQSVLDTAGDAFIGMDARGRITDWNAAAAETFGWSAEEVLGRELEGVLVPERYRQAYRTELADFHATGRHRLPDGPVQFTALTRGGFELPVELTLAAMRWRGGYHVHGFVRDITDRVRAADELTEAERRFRVAFDSAPVPMALAGLDTDAGRLNRVNAALCELLGYDAEALEERTLSDVTHPDDREATDELVAQMAAGLVGTSTSAVRCLHADGHAVWVEMSTNVIRDVDDRPKYAVTQIDDVTDRRAETERLNALALQDPLTGLANRLLLNDRLAQAIIRTSRSFRTLAVLMCDLDGFKPVNDTYGHAAGDAVLKEVATRIRAAVRPADTVARVGGDEFVVLCEDMEAPHSPAAIVQRINESLVEPILVGATQVRIGVSVGMAVGEGPGLTADELLATADADMYAHKRAPRAVRS
jgi:diguanylate cyclase (GGDEF)-like protein/PAS domain S-box-containing protein